jgi:cell wall-associated NlpC family hydrolase
MKKILALALLVPLPLAAQTRSTISPFVAADGSVDHSPVMVGLSGSRESGRLGLRASAAVDARSTPLSSWMSSPAGEHMAVWSANLDALLFLADPVRGGSAPYLVVGVGGQKLRGAESATGANYAYGAGVRAPLLGPLAMEGEVRYRRPFGQPDLDSPIGSGLEFRFGLSVRMGGARHTSISAPAPILRTPASPAVATASGAARMRIAERTLDTASQYLGIPYKWGGSTPQEGFDCSGFVHYVFAEQGIELPRTSAELAQVGAPLPLDIGAFEPGDLLAFAGHGTDVDHIAIYAGNGRIIQASSSGGNVRYSDITGPRGRWYRDHRVAARRVIGATTVASGGY